MRILVEGVLPERLRKADYWWNEHIAVCPICGCKVMLTNDDEGADLQENYVQYKYRLFDCPTELCTGLLKVFRPPAPWEK